MNRRDNSIVVTGGSSGIGLALAKAFLSAGNKVVICGRDSQKLERAVTEAPGLTPTRCDITKDIDRQELAARIASELPGFNILVNNAGIQNSYRFTESDERLRYIEAEIDINFTSQVKLTHCLLPALLKQPKAAIVNVTSALAVVPKESAPVYCGAKAGLRVFTKALRYQLDNTSIRVFEIIPALVDTPMTQGRGKGKISPEELAAEALEAMAADRFEIRIGKTKALFWINRFIPWLAERIIRHS